MNIFPKYLLNVDLKFIIFVYDLSIFGDGTMDVNQQPINKLLLFADSKLQEKGHVQKT